MSTMLAALQKRRSPTALPTILVVDAGVSFGLALMKSLGQCGYDMRLATSADQAVRCVHARRFDFMIVHDEGHGRGRAAVFAVRGVVPTMPCTIVSDEPAAEGEETELAHAGSVGVLGTPLDLDRLVASIERALKAAPPEQLVCTIADSEFATRRDLPVVSADDRPTRQQPRLSTRRLPAMMEDPPEVVRSQRATVKIRALDAGRYSIQRCGRDVVEPIPAH